MNASEFFYRFGRALYLIDTYYDEFAKKRDKTSSGELWVLFALNDGNEYSQKQIAEDWEIPKTTVNFVIKNLETRGLVELLPIQGKRREKLIRLTESGKIYANALLGDMYQKENAVFQTLENGEDFLAEFEALAEKLKIIGRD